MIKICIVGGGIAGLATATVLADQEIFDISIYEKESDIGGQARSEFAEHCYTEYSWRIFGNTYSNLIYLINKLQIENNFVDINACFIENDQARSNALDTLTLLNQILNSSRGINTINKLANIILICKERAITEYINVNAYEYFNKNKVIQTLLGPFLGMDANKVSLSGFYKNYYGTMNKTQLSQTSLVTRGPTQNAFFDPWKLFLQKRGVKIYTENELQNIYTDNKRIDGVVINGNLIQADEYVFACSLTPMLDICLANPYLRQLKTINNLQPLIKDLQLYFTINIYFSETLDKSNNCKEIVILDMPWKPIIQKKRSWQNKYQCTMNQTKIKDIWNVGFLDYNKGLLIKKDLHECSITEAIKEGLYEIKHSKYVQKLLKNKSFEDVYMGYEYWHQFKDNKEHKLVSENPKFSINTGTMSYMPTIQPKDLPPNMYLCGYYVQSTMGGVSMESSCETGFAVGKKLLEKYDIKDDSVIPIGHNAQYITILTLPFLLLDFLLYKLHIGPITNMIPSLLLLGIYVCFILVMLGLILLKLTNYLSFKHLS